MANIRPRNEKRVDVACGGVRHHTEEFPSLGLRMLGMSRRGPLPVGSRLSSCGHSGQNKGRCTTGQSGEESPARSALHHRGATGLSESDEGGMRGKLHCCMYGAFSLVSFVGNTEGRSLLRTRALAISAPLRGVVEVALLLGGTCAFTLKGRRVNISAVSPACALCSESRLCTFSATTHLRDSLVEKLAPLHRLQTPNVRHGAQTQPIGLPLIPRARCGARRTRRPTAWGWAFGSGVTSKV